MFKPAKDPTTEQYEALENVARCRVDALANLLRESHGVRVRAIYIERLINQAEDPDGGDGLGLVRAEVKRLLSKDDG